MTLSMRFIADKKQRLDAFLSEKVPDQSRSKLSKHIESGGAKVDGKQRKPSFILTVGSVVEVDEIPETTAHTLEPVDIPLEIVYEDDWLLVVDKPAGLSVHPSPTSNEPTLVHALLARQHALSTEGGDYRPGIVHRLDKGTSGLLLVAKNDKVHRQLQVDIQSKKVTRKYLALVRGKPNMEKFTIRSYLGRHPKFRKKFAVVPENAPGARLSITHCQLKRVISEKPPICLLECVLETGRTHQIRVHLASIGLPILGDKEYGVQWEDFEHQALHAYQIELKHPVSGENLMLTSGRKFP